MKKSSYVITLLSALTAGLFLYAWQSDQLVICWRGQQLDPARKARDLFQNAAHDCTVDLFLPGSDAMPAGQRAIIMWDANDLAFSLDRLMRRWLGLAQQEGCIPLGLEIQSVVLGNGNKDLIISVNRSLFGACQSIRSKWLLIEALLATLRPLSQGVNRVWLLMRHQPMQDEHLDLSCGLCLMGYLGQNA